MSDVTFHQVREMKDGLYELMQKYFVMYSELFKMRSVVSPEEYKIFSKTLGDSYKRDLEFYNEGVLLDSAQARWERKERLMRYVPRRKWLFWRNRVAKAIGRNVDRDFERFLSILEQGFPEGGSSSSKEASADEQMEGTEESSVVPVVID